MQNKCRQRKGARNYYRLDGLSADTVLIREQHAVFCLLSIRG